MKAHFTELDGIRGILSLVILLFHLGLNPLIEKLSFGVITEGRYELAVDFFFILSGFVLCHVSRSRKPAMLRFLIGRAFRMLPVSTAALALCLVATRTTGDASTFVANLLLIQLFLGLPHLNRVAWSACSEMWMPAFLGYGAWLGQELRRPMLWTLLIVVAVLDSLALSDVLSEDRFLTDVVRSFAGLSAGFLFCMLHRPAHLTATEGKPTKTTLVMLLSAALIMVLGGKFGYLVFAFPFVAGFAIVGLLHVKSFLSGRVCQFFGARSYALYMMHWPVLLFFNAHFGPETMKGNVVLKGGIVVLSIILADLTHRFVETPCLRLRGKLMAGGA
jgi:peptidoglycan/LPS O-acetylase OafA/YrhL